MLKQGARVHAVVDGNLAIGILTKIEGEMATVLTLGPEGKLAKLPMGKIGKMEPGKARMLAMMVMAPIADKALRAKMDAIATDEKLTVQQKVDHIACLWFGPNFARTDYTYKQAAYIVAKLRVKK